MERIYLNNDWRFSPTFKKVDAKNLNQKYQTVRIPHTVVETPFNYFDESIYQMVSCYQRVLKLSKKFEGKYISLVFEGVAHYAEVYFNGKLVAKHKSGYTAFKADISKLIKFNEDNLITVKVDSNETLNVPPFGKVIDYMTYGGIYRDVYLEVGDIRHIEDVFVKTLTNGATMLLSTVSLCESAKGLRIVQKLKNLDGTLVSEYPKDEVNHMVNNIKLWSVDNPNLYLLETDLMDGKKIVDTFTVRFGFREIDFNSEGLFINGLKVPFMGLDRHQSFPYVGYAMPKSMQVLDADILKYELGLNAVRTSHYPQSQHFIDRCDEIGLLVFTEIPGWQHIGDEAWKKQAVYNTEEMVLQYRNHPSIFLWGVRINESVDDDELYEETNGVAHDLDDTRPTSGVRYIQNSSLLEDVYAYNDFSHTGNNPGVLPKNKVTKVKECGYLVSEYNGHMYPTKANDDEPHRLSHMKRHAQVINDVAGNDEIAGSFGWCMFDYNTHKDFGSGDRICYHGVMDMFRNPKLAASVYASQSENTDVLEVTSGMDIGDYPAGTIPEIYAITNADSVKVYKNDTFIKEYFRKDTPYTNLKHGPILIDDFIGDQLMINEGFSKRQSQLVKDVLLAANKYGMTNLPASALAKAAQCITLYGMSMDKAIELYGKYIGNWGGTVTTYKFEAYKNGELVNTVMKAPYKDMKLDVKVSHNLLKEENTYDVAAVRIRALSDSGNVLSYLNEPIEFEASGSIELIGPKLTVFRGGMIGTYVKSVKKGKGKLKITALGHIEEILFEVEKV